MDVVSLLLEPTFWIGLFAVALFALYKYGTRTYHVFSDRGIPGPRPLPFVGNLWGTWRQDRLVEEEKMLKQYGQVFGIFEGDKPVQYVADPEMIKHILIKDFDHFVNHQVGGTHDSIMQKLIFIMVDNEWKICRSVVTPIFSTGRIKKMSGVIQEHIDRSAAKLKKQAQNGFKIQPDKLYSEISVGVISQCAFGLKLDSAAEKKDIFLETAMAWFDSFSQDQSIKSLLPYLLPTYFPEFELPPEGLTFFLDNIKKVIAERSKSDERYNDFLEMFTESFPKATKEVNGQKVLAWTGDELDEVICAQALEFFIDGYVSTSMTLGALSYELALHPEIQDKLYNDIMDKLSTFGRVSHEMILEMPYAEQLINESLRLHPVLLRIDRMCNKDITIKGVHIAKGTKVLIPAYIIHHSEEHFPDPETFNPDRWSVENKGNIDPYTYLPFGGGPRGCPGTRFAMEQMKLAICTMISQFEFYPVEETPAKVTFPKGYQATSFAFPITLGVRVRKNQPGTA